MADTAPDAGQTAVIIVAAGRGSRAGGDMPKQYRPLLGKSVLRRTIEAFRAADPDARILCVIHPDDMDFYRAVTEGLALIDPVPGGATRQQSVANGLAALAAHAPDYVLVHDAARPFMTKAVYHGVLAALAEGAQAVVPGVAVTDTLKRAPEKQIERTVDRTDLYAVQTPQGFPYPALRNAHANAPHQDFTDDAAVMEAAGASVTVSAGERANFKLTTPEDFTRAEEKLMLMMADVRTGTGFDVHRFEPGDHVWLCGIKVPNTQSLKGHSDADVALHALTDAILAAIADGDIGQHFPPTDERWRGAPSHEFLSFAAERVRARGGIIAHLTVTIICERPKVGPHMQAMRTRIADIAGIDMDRVSVQATTTEKLGFTGRDEGIAAQASATVRLPFPGEPA